MTNNKVKNCECCLASYEGYKVGEESEKTSYWCELPNRKAETKGLCGFCNPKSNLYNHSPEHARESCRIK